MNSTLETRHCPLNHPGNEPPPQAPFGAYICRTCIGTLRGLLTDLQGLMDDVDAAIGRQLMFTTRNGTARSADTPLPVNMAASDTAWASRQTILANVDEIATIRGHTIPQTWAAIGTYLSESANWMSRHPDAEEWFDTLIYALREARRVTDRPADRAYAGKCGGNNIDHNGLLIECQQALYARPGALIVVCPVCGTEWPVADRRQHMLNRVEHMHLPATDLAKAINGLFNTTIVQPATIRQWRKRGLIHPTSTNHKGQPIYAVKDVMKRALNPQQPTSATG